MGRDAWNMRDHLGNAPAREPRNSRPWPKNKLQAIALEVPFAGSRRFRVAARTLPP
jgi:hypothetical protein